MIRATLFFAKDRLAGEDVDNISRGLAQAAAEAMSTEDAPEIGETCLPIMLPYDRLTADSHDLELVVTGHRSEMRLAAQDGIKFRLLSFLKLATSGHITSGVWIDLVDQAHAEFPDRTR